MTSMASPMDIDWKHGKHSIPIDQVQIFALYFYHEKKLVLSKPDDALEISLEPFNFELITVSPIKTLPNNVQFAAIGLVNMLNSGGAIKAVDESNKDGMCSVRVSVKGTGEMRAFVSQKPKVVRVEGEEVEFTYEADMVVVHVPWPNSSISSVIEYLF